jgi:peptidoglycan hydrolase-like protein with peptidoglycan-binding domain
MGRAPHDDAWINGGRWVVSGAISGGRDAGPQPESRAAAEVAGSRGRGRWVALGVMVVLVAGVVAGWRMGMFSAAASPAAGPGARQPATAVVTRQDLMATTPESATLGYAGFYTVRGQGSGTLTWLPPAGQVLRQGQALYETGNGSPVVLLYGGVPDWRALSVGTTGQDVTQLNHNLANLGYAARADIAADGWDYYSWETALAVQQMEEHLGVVSPPGSLSLGQVLFEPGAIRVSHVTGVLGGPAAGPVLTATSDRHVVTIPLDASDQSQVRAGDKVTVTLPDGTTVPGLISSVGAVATTTQGQQEQGPTTTIPVQVKLAHPEAAGTLDQAPVTVNITTASAENTLAVPVSALLAQSPRGYDVEVAGRGSRRRWVPVQPGIFDDASGLVQVTGALRPGLRVVVASS